MIFFLIEAFERGSVETLEKRVGTDLGARIKCLIYDDLPLLPDFGPGTYIFGNFGLLSRAYQTCALELADALTDAGPGFRVLNHPRRVLDRFELLKKWPPTASMIFRFTGPESGAPVPFLFRFL